MTLPAGSFTVPEMLPLTLAQSIVAEKLPSTHKTVKALMTERMTLLDILSLLFTIRGRSLYWMVMGTLTLV